MGDEIHRALAPFMPFVFALLFLAGGTVVASAGYANLASLRKKRQTWLAVNGTVVDFIERRSDPGSGRSRTLYAPVCRYTLEGRQYDCTSRIAANPPGYNVGDPIPLVVNPLKPGDADVVHASMFLFSYAAIALGVLVFAVGVLIARLVWTGQMTFE